MERPWLILCRVIELVQPDADDLHWDWDVQAQQEVHAAAEEAEQDAAADAGEAEEDVQAQQEVHAAGGEAEQDAQLQPEEHAAAGEADENAQAQQEQHAAVGEAEEDPQAQEDDHAEVGEAEEDPQAQEDDHAAVEEAEHDPQVQLEESVVNVNTNAATAVAVHAEHREPEPDFTISVSPPPWVSYVIAGRSAHPYPDRPDMYPYIVATGRFLLLAHFSVEPSYGTNFNDKPDHSNLVVVRYFLRNNGQVVARARPLPDRPNYLLAPSIVNIESVGLACDTVTGHYTVAELMITTGSPMALLFYLRTNSGFWQENILDSPFNAVDRHRHWVPHGTVTINSTIVWFDLTWGMISCDMGQPFHLQELCFHRLPRGRILRAGAPMPDLHCRRCITVSENLVRYVEITIYPHEPATVTMWYRDVEGDPWRWVMNYKEKFEDIWDDASYIDTELPRNPPVLVGVSPVDSNVVYFALELQLFGVNVPAHTVVECEEYDPVNKPGPPDEPISSRYFITWNLDPDVAINAGHELDDHVDYGDSDDDGSVDELELEYQSPEE